MCQSKFIFICILGSLVSPSNWVDNNVPGPVKVLPNQDSPHATVSIWDLNSICAWETKDRIDNQRMHQSHDNVTICDDYQHQSNRVCLSPSQLPDLLGSPGWCPPPPGKLDKALNSKLLAYKYIDKILNSISMLGNMTSQVSFVQRESHALLNYIH